MLNKSLFSSKTNEWSTPQKFFDELNKEFNFTLDPCATKENAKCKKFYTEKDNGLIQDWSRERIFCNPPYGSCLKDWVKKCYEIAQDETLVVLLIPARTDTKYFHQYIYKQKNVEIRFIKGRLKFGDSKNSAPFPSMLVIYNGLDKH